MLLGIVLMRHNAEKLKYFSFATSLKICVAGDVGKNAYHIWFTATGRLEKRDKCESTLMMELFTCSFLYICARQLLCCCK